MAELNFVLAGADSGTSVGALIEVLEDGGDVGAITASVPEVKIDHPR